MSAGTCIDTNVLLDLAVPASPHAEVSTAALDAAAARGPLFIGAVTYAEMTVHFVRAFGGEAEEAGEDLDLFLHEAGIVVAPFPVEASATAGRAYARYLGTRDARKVGCPECGEANEPSCKACGAALRWRAHILTDFLIGAHALHTSGALLTRDRHLHRRIPGLKVLTP